VVGTSGNVDAVGDAEYEFTIMSVSKPFLFALVCRELGVEEARQKIGVNATGRAFNSLEGIERNPDGRTNPMVNSGAIATTSLVPGANFEAKWKFIHEGLSRFAGRALPLNDEVYVCASETNYRNQSIARMLQSYGRIYLEPAQAVDLYTKQCALNVSARDLAVMGAGGPSQVPESGEAFWCSLATATDTCSKPTSLLLVGSKPHQPAPGR
jgi:glutaminase